MSLQWGAVAFILYVEIVVLLILLLPWIRPSFWSRFFRSRIVSVISTNAQVGFYAGCIVLFILFADAIREVRKYSNIDIDLNTARHAETDSVVHSRLFRAQRNLYISGFALLLFLIIRRLVDLIQRGAQLQASCEAALRQADNATKTARTLMDAGDDDDEKKKLARQVEELSEELKLAQDDRDTMKKQAEGLQKEYDRVCDLLNESSGKDGKKDD